MAIIRLEDTNGTLIENVEIDDETMEKVIETSEKLGITVEEYIIKSLEDLLKNTD